MLNMELVIRFKKTRFVLAAFLLMAVAVTSCKKAEDRTCFKKIGKDAELTIALPEFNKLLLREQIEFVLIQDSTDKLVIKGGENLIKHISWSVNSENLLEIKNANKCNFLRKLDKKVKVEIHFTSLYNLHYEGTEPLTSLDTLNTPYFVMMIRDGAGSVKLNLRAVVIEADISHGWGDYTLSGRTAYARIAARSNGFCDVRNLKISDSVLVSSETAGTIKLNANGIPLRGQLSGYGDVWYYGIPSLIDVREISTGKLVSKN